MEEMKRTMLIVEDEPLARLGLKTTIPWDKHGISIVGEARNGEEGFQKALELKPDIILSDLKMPRMDGAEMIKALRERGNESEIIILSGYGEFEYARTAIEANVASYLLKPVSNEQLIDAVLKSCSRLEEKERSLLARGVLQTSREEMKRKLVRSLIRLESLDALPEIERQAHALGLPAVQEGRFLIGILDEPTKEDQEELSYLEEEIEDSFRVSEIPCTSGIYHQKLALIAGTKDIERLEKAIQRALERYEKRTKLTCSIGISAPFEGALHVHEAYEEAKSVATNGLMKFVNSVQIHNEASSRYTPNLIRAVEIIDTEYMKPLSVSLVAERLNVSPSYLMHLIQRELRTTFNSLLTKTRIREAETLLRSGKYRVNEVAYKVGYGDEKYFTEVFKKQTGKTPSQYMKGENERKDGN